jgi:hypothetical protein
MGTSRCFYQLRLAILPNKALIITLNLIEKDVNRIWKACCIEERWELGPDPID